MNNIKLPADDAVQNWFEENIDKECSASSAIYKFRLWLRSLQNATPLSASKFIVAEISKNWTPGDPITELLSNKFEYVINTNEQRGYELADWKLSQVCNENIFTETIIAIFKKKDA